MARFLRSYPAPWKPRGPANLWTLLSFPPTAAPAPRSTFAALAGTRRVRSYRAPPRYGTGRLWVLSKKPTVTYSPSTNYVIDMPMTLTPTVHGVVNTGGFVVTSGTLPSGLSIDADTGVISGTPDTVESQTVTVTATNPYGTSAPSFTIEIVASSSGGAQSTFSDSSLPGIPLVESVFVLSVFDQGI